MTLPSRDPALIWNPLPEAESQAKITPYQVIVHTAVDGRGSTDLQSYFENHTSLESHTWLRWAQHEQMMDFLRRADANYKANQFYIDGVSYGAISIETEDDGSPEENPWNVYQVKELIRFITWCCKTYSIPAELPTAWNAPGVGYHSLFPMVWSNVRGKTCPGSTRIKQFKEVILPAVKKALSEPQPQPEEKDDMPAGFLVKLNKDRPEVLQVSSAREVHWVRSSTARKGYQLQNEIDGGNQEVCTLDHRDTTDHIVKLRAMVLNLPWVGEMPEGYAAIWTGPVNNS
jgi:hypothetical protein